MARTAALLAALTIATGCGSTVVIEGEGSSGQPGSSDPATSGLSGDTRVVALRDGDVVVLDAEGGMVTAWTQDTFFPPLRVHISPDGSAVGFGARRYQYDNNYDAIAGGVASAKPIPGASPMGSVAPLGGGTVAWRNLNGRVRVTDADGNPQAADDVVRISALDVKVGPNGDALYFPSDEGVMRLDLADGTTRRLGYSVLGPVDVSLRGDIVGGAGPGEVRMIDASGSESTVCRFPSFDDGCHTTDPDDSRHCFYQPERPRWSPDGSRVVFVARRDTVNVKGAGIFSCEVGGSGPVLIGDRSKVGGTPVFDASGQRVLYLRRDGFFALDADGEGDLEVLVADEEFDGNIDVAWLR